MSGTTCQPLVGVSEDEIAERVLAELRTAVELRKVSDVPVGVFLSGGIDSSTNAALFSEGERARSRRSPSATTASTRATRTSCTTPAGWRTAVGAEHHERLLTQDDLLDFLPEMVQLQDEPIADPVCVPVYYVSKLARDNGVIVCQVGEGADELFCGYPTWKPHAAAAALGRPARAAARSSALDWPRSAGSGRDGGMRYEWLRRGAAGQPVFWGGAEAFTQRAEAAPAQPAPAASSSRASRRGRRSRRSGAASRTRPGSQSHLNWMTYLDLNLRLPELLLMRVDKMSMGVSLEGRVPFLDHKFVELAMSIPTEVKTANGELKHILKKAVRGVIPDE